MSAHEVNLADPATFEQGMPHEWFRWLRTHAPVFWHERGVELPAAEQEKSSPRGFWALTRHQDIVTVSKDPQRFSSARGSMLIRDLDSDRLAQMRDWLINLDGSAHVTTRRLVARAYSPAFVRRFEPTMRLAVREALDAIAPLGECDFAKDVAGPMPFQVTAAILGIPAADRSMVGDWLDQVVGLEDVEPDVAAGPQQAAARIFEYLSNFAREERRRPTSDLVRGLIEADVDGERLSANAIDLFLLLFTMASNETTRNAIANGLLALIQNPDQYRRLRQHPHLLDSAVDEMLRFDGPAIHMRRTATCDTEIGGQAIRENDKVVMFYSAANRDESVFADPDRFDVGRTPNPHLAFGIGPHYCMGAQQSWTLMRCLFEELIPRFTEIGLDGPVARLRSVAINGIRSLPVRYRTNSIS